MTDDWARIGIERVYGGNIEMFKKYETTLNFLEPDNQRSPLNQYLDNITTDNSVIIRIDSLTDFEIERIIRGLNNNYENIENILVLGNTDHISKAKIFKEKIPYEKLPNINVIKYIDDNSAELNTQATEILMSKLLPSA